MLKNEIKLNETYLFFSTESPTRKHLEGTEFEVVEIKKVYRKQTYGRRRRTVKVTRFFNPDGVGARADELEPLPDREAPCNECLLGEMKETGRINNSTDNFCVTYTCDYCGATASYP